MPPPDLAGTTVFITGASRGLGAALARDFAHAGARLVLCARSEPPLAALSADLQEDGAQVEWAAVDVTDERAVGALVLRAEERFGGVDVLINNASILGSRVPLREQPLEEWRAVMEVNLTGTLVATRAVLPGMRGRRSGSIINVSSGVGNQHRAEWGPYAVSKWAVEGLSGNLALEEGDAGIRVNVVDPGALQTEMRRAAYPDENPSAPTPPEEITGVFLWLASDDARGVTGERFHAQRWNR